MMLSCKEATRLVSQGLDRRLPFGRIELRSAGAVERHIDCEADLGDAGHGPDAFGDCAAVDGQGRRRCRRAGRNGCSVASW